MTAVNMLKLCFQGELEQKFEAFKEKLSAKRNIESPN